MYAIKVEKINEDGTRSPFDFGAKRDELVGDGLVILSITPNADGTGVDGTCAIVNTSVRNIATAMNGESVLVEAANLVAFSALRKVLTEEDDHAAD